MWKLYSEQHLCYFMLLRSDILFIFSIVKWLNVCDTNFWRILISNFGICIISKLTGFVKLEIRRVVTPSFRWLLLYLLFHTILIFTCILSRTREYINPSMHNNNRISWRFVRVKNHHVIVQLTWRCELLAIKFTWQPSYLHVDRSLGVWSIYLQTNSNAIVRCRRRVPVPYLWMFPSN